jgi:hypothetical protein
MEQDLLNTPTSPMTDRRRERIRLFLFIAGAAALALFVTVLAMRFRPVTFRGAVVRASEDPNREAPIAGVQITASEGNPVGSTRSGDSGGFAITLRRSLIRRHAMTLSFRHAGYKPYDIFDPSPDILYVIKMLPLATPPAALANKPTVRISNPWVRYTVKTEATIEVGSSVKTFEVVNKGDVPCRGNPPCSPDGKWKTAVASATLDAGPDNEFRNGRVSCIAGPCAFTAIRRDDFSRGGRTIGVTVIDWSDTVTFLLQAEAIRRVHTESVRKTYPVVFDHTLNFSVPASAQGTCIEAEVDGTDVVFPIGPNLWLSWADCDTQLEPEDTRLYRCELKPGYAFR